MASQWKMFQRLAENLVFNEAPKLIRQLQRPENLPRGIQQGIKIGLEVLTGTAVESPAAITTGRPVTNNSVPTAQRARRLVYAPDLDGRADPGEVVWTWVAYEEDATQGKDRPVAVLGRRGDKLLAVALTSKRHDRDPQVSVGKGPWDREGRTSYAKVDRLLEVDPTAVRREGAVLPRRAFDAVVAGVRAQVR